MFGKKLLSLVIAATLLCTGLSQSTVYAAQGTTGRGTAEEEIENMQGLIYIELEDGTLGIQGYDGIYKEKLVIPSEIEGKRVTSIEAYAFEYSNFTSITIPEGVTSIGKGAFAYCSFESMNIPNTVINIEENAFNHCSFSSIIIPEGVQSIGKGAFSGCYNLTSVTIPETVTSIGEGAFCDCRSSANGGLTEVVVDSNNAHYTSKDGVLYNKDMTELVLCPAGKTEFVIPEGVTTIGGFAFSGCISLQSIIIPEGVTSIGEGAFCGCGLKSVTIPEGVTSIGEGAFRNCKLTEIVVDSNNAQYVSKNGVLYNKNMTKIMQYPAAKTELDIPEGVTNIGGFAFSGCNNLKNVTIPEGVTSIGEGAFCNCNSLTSVTILEGITAIENQVFRDCINLTSVTIPNGTTSIKDRAFFGCYNLTSVTIPKGVTSIGNEAFKSCTMLKELILPESLLSIEDFAFNGSGLASVTIPETVTHLGYCAFYNCGLTSVTIPKGITDMEEDVFSFCLNLTDVIFSEGITNITEGIFSDCRNLVNVTIPEGVTTIGKRVFTNCEKLEEVILPESLTTIEERAFYYCNGLKKLAIPKAVTNLGTDAIFGCRNVTLYVYHNSCAERYAQLGNINYCYIDECEHNYTSEITKQPTCTKAGETTYTCTECGDSYTEPISAKGHNLKEIVKKATEKENGSITKQCTECQAVEGEPTIIYAIESIELSETSYVFDGSVKRPTVTVKDSQGNALQEQRDYTVSYPEDAKDEGIYTVTIVLSGNYTGTVERTFTIIRDHIGILQGDYTYGELGDGSLEIIKYTGKETELVIPEKLNDKIVSRIGEHAFSNCSNLISVTIPENVTSIGQRAFASCNLKSVTLPQGITCIEKELFIYSGLTSITIPEGVTTIGDSAFLGCSDLVSVTIPEGVTSIGEAAFGGCSNLTSVTIPEGVTSIEEGTFSECLNLTSVTIPEGVTSIGFMAFTMNHKLKDVIIPKSVISIGKDVFQGCNNIVLCVYHDSYAERYAQENSIEYRYIGECEHNYKEIVKKATEKENGSITKQCTECQAVEGEPTIIYAAENIELSENSYICDGSVKRPTVTAKDSQGNALQEQKDYTVSYPKDAKNEGTYTVTIVLSGNYTGTVKRTFTILPDNTGSFQGDYTYRELEDGSLEITKYTGKDTELVIPEKLNDKIISKIGEHAFSNCTNLIRIIIPENVVSIGTGAFSGCSNLVSVAIPESVVSIGTDIFSGCSEDLTLQVAPGSYGESYAEENNVNHKNPTACEHNYIAQTTTEPTCTTIGEKVYTCTKCGDIEKRETIPALGHKEVKDPGKEATCTEEGKTEGSHCEICQTVLKQSEVIPALGHREVKDPGKEATCTEEGRSEGSHCEVCQTVLKRQEVLPALGHTYQKEIMKATTTKNGSIVEKCAKCGSKKSQTTINAVKTVKLSKTSFVYNGKSQKPSITVKDSKGKILGKQRDYTVTYPKTVKNVGIYTVKIKLKGNYNGTVTKTYTITPKGTSISKITPKKKSFVVTWKKQAKQITGYEVAYSINSKFAKKNTTILNAAKSKTTAKPKKALKAQKKYYVRVRTYKTIKQGGKTKKVYAEWSKAKRVVTKK